MASRAAVLRAGAEPHEPVGKRLKKCLHEGRLRLSRAGGKIPVNEPIELLRRPQHVVCAAWMQFKVGPAGWEAGMKPLQGRHTIDNV